MRENTIWKDIEKIRARAPLVHNITNYVVMNTTANALLAIGASPVMAHAIEEAADMAALRREAHTVKSMLATFSYEAGRLLALRLEELAASGNFDGAQALTDELVAAVKRLVAALATEGASGAT